MGNEVTVSRIDGVSALLRFAADIDRLNAAASRPNAFASSAYSYTYALRNEYRLPGEGERLFLVREGARIIGCAAMREVKQRLSPESLGPLGISGARLELLAASDGEASAFVCAAGDDERVAAALVRHYCEEEARWGMLELVGQKPGGVMHRALHAAQGVRVWARDIAVQPYTEVPLTAPDLQRYFRSLSKHMRSNIGRQARRMYASGRTELLLAEGAQAVGAWFDAYCDLDNRSWKQDTESSIARLPRRVRFYRAIAEGKAGFDPSFVGVILDGVLVAGLLIGSNQSGSPARHGAWCLEMAYDRSRADLGPGQLLLLMAVGQALQRGDAFLNFLQNFAYYKHRWGAQSIDVVNVQLLRRLTPHDARARVGDLRRWWTARKSANIAGEPTMGADSAKEHPESEATEAPVNLERARSLTALALENACVGMRVLDRAAAREYLPFDLE